MVEADWRLADLVLCEAYRRTPAARRREVGDFLAAAPKSRPSRRPERSLSIPCTASLFSRAVRSVRRAAQERAIGEWKFPADEIKPYVDEINELQGSTLVLNPLQQQDRVEAVLDKALTGRSAASAAIARAAGLEDIAYYMAHADARETARWASAAAAALRDGADLKRIAFFRGFIRLVLGATLAEQEERAKEEPRLIMTPAEAMRAQQERARSR